MMKRDVINSIASAIVGGAAVALGFVGYQSALFKARGVAADGIVIEANDNLLRGRPIAAAFLAGVAVTDSPRALTLASAAEILHQAKEDVLAKKLIAEAVAIADPEERTFVLRVQQLVEYPAIQRGEQ